MKQSINDILNEKDINIEDEKADEKKNKKLILKKKKVSNKDSENILVNTTKSDMNTELI